MESESPTNHVLRLPELLEEMVLHLSTQADISSLSRCNRTFREIVTPLLFRNLSIYIKDTPVIAGVLQNNPHFARRCSTFMLRPNYHYSVKDDSQYPEWFHNLTLVVSSLADQAANFKVFSWCLPVLCLEVPLTVWRALGRLSSSLEQLTLRFSELNQPYWPAMMCEPVYSKLKVLRLGFDHNTVLDGTSLQTMLHNLPQLETLHLELPRHSQGLDFSSSHPHLRTFHLIGHNNLDRQVFHFLKQHPTIEYLQLHWGGSSVLDDHDLPRLKALGIGQINGPPTLLIHSAGRIITHLYAHDLPDLPNEYIFQRIEGVSSTLRHLELGWWVESFRKDMPVFRRMLRLVPRLEELRIIAESDGASDQLSAKDLLDFLTTIKGSTSITRLGFIDPGSDDLTQSQLDDMDMGVVPPSLVYISWLGWTELTYRLEYRGGKTVAILVEFPDTWTPFDYSRM